MSSSICTVASTILITNLETINMMIKVAAANAVFLFISSQKISMNLLHDIARYMDRLSGTVPPHLTMIFGQKKAGISLPRHIHILKLLNKCQAIYFTCGTIR